MPARGLLQVHGGVTLDAEFVEPEMRVAQRHIEAARAFGGRDVVVETEARIAGAGGKAPRGPDETPLMGEAEVAAAGQSINGPVSYLA